MGFAAILRRFGIAALAFLAVALGAVVGVSPPAPADGPSVLVAAAPTWGNATRPEHARMRGASAPLVVPSDRWKTSPLRSKCPKVESLAADSLARATASRPLPTPRTAAARAVAARRLSYDPHGPPSRPA